MAGAAVAASKTDDSSDSQQPKFGTFDIALPGTNNAQTVVLCFMMRERKRIEIENISASTDAERHIELLLQPREYK